MSFSGADNLSNDELRRLVEQLLDEVATLRERVCELEAENAALREENARLKGHKGRPKLKPSGMEKATGGGKTKAGRGTYTRRRPFVHMIFPDIDSAIMVLTSQAPLVEAVRLGYVVTEGAMEGSKEMGYHMQRIEEMTGAYA